MSFLNLKRLLLRRQMWKVFTNKLQIKLHKLIRSKAIKKSKPRSRILGWPSLSIRAKKLKHKHKLKLPHASIHLHKRTPPVYVDQLFVEPSVSGTKEQLKPEGEIVMMSDEKSNINERAEEFIARFRNQMRHQEILARRL